PSGVSCSGCADRIGAHGASLVSKTGRYRVRLSAPLPMAFSSVERAVGLHPTCRGFDSLNANKGPVHRFLGVRWGSNPQQAAAWLPNTRLAQRIEPLATNQRGRGFESRIGFHTFVVQRTEHRFPKPDAVGSNPTEGARKT